MTWRDPWGVPRIRAGSVTGLAFEQGRVTAHDRAWQLEVERLRAEGRTADVVGVGGAGWDTFSHRARIEETARRAFDALGDETRAFVTAYVDGVRTAFDEGATSPELERLGVSPADSAVGWQPWTPLGIFLVQHVLFASFPGKLWRHHVARTVGPEAVDLLRPEGLPNGSNCLGLGPTRTASGHPLVAGDPHRLFETPNVYVQVGLSCPEFDVVGLSFAGVPGVQHFGHTGPVAWALTNAMADYQDLVPEGPVVVEGPDEAFGLRTSSMVLGDLGFDALLPLLRARTVADVDAALDHWVEPVNNFVVADREGRVLHRVAGRVPVREGGRWTGWAELPRLEAGDDGLLVTANDRTTPEFAVLGDGFAAPFRRDRIRELLEASRDWTSETVTSVLTDTRQTAGQALLDLVGTLTGLPAPAAALRERLLAWDRRMDSDSRDAALFAALREEVVARICSSDVLAPLTGPCPYGDLYAPWFDLRVRVAVSLHVWLAAERPLGLDLPGIVAESLGAVAASPPQGGWGERHRFTPVHAFADFGLDPVDLVPDVAGSALSGDTDCVAATGWIPGSEACVRGPVARYAWDLGDRSLSRWAVPEPGQFDAWSSGRLVPVEPFTLVPVDPERHADLLHDWVTRPRASFWGMLERTRDEVAEIYGYIQEQDHLSASLVCTESVPVGIFQTYDPEVDEIGRFYDRRPGDLGVHLFLADVPERKGTTASLVAFLLDHALARPGVERLVLEPDVANERSIALLQRAGATLGPVRRLPGKTAQLAFVERATMAAIVP